MNTPVPQPITSHNPSGTYTPGYAGCKLLMALVGFTLFSFGFTQVWTPLRLLIFGKHAVAEAISVIKSKEGLPNLVLKSDSEVARQREPYDRSYTFWNEFTFRTTDGGKVEVCANVGSHVGPLYPLIDEDGMPSSMLVCYDPAKPEHAIFPLLISTWLAPCVLMLAGLVCAISQLVLLYWANKPIALPHIPKAEETETMQGKDHELLH